MPESIFNDKYAGEESSELSVEEQVQNEEASILMPGETHQSNEADGAQSAEATVAT
jgi:hypothetical protein